MLLTVMIWGVNFSVVKASISHIPGMAFNVFRLVGCSTILLGLSFFAPSVSLTRRELGRILFLGLVGHTLYQFCFIFAIDATTASNSALIMAMTPVMVAAIGALTGVEKSGLNSWLGIFTSVVGVYLVMSSSSATGGSLWGDLLMLSATLCWSIYTVASKDLLQRHGPLKVTTYSMLMGSAFFVPFGIPTVLRMPTEQIPWAAWVGLVYSFVFALTIAYLAWYYAVSRVGPTRTAVYSNLTPAAALLTSWLALGERILPTQLVGAAVIFLGIYLVRTSAVPGESA